MRLEKEVLLKSFGNGIAMLRFQQGQTPDTVGPYITSRGISAKEFVIGEPSSDVYLLLEEGHPVSRGEARNTDDDWDSLVAAVRAGGSDAFRARVSRLEVDRKSVLDLGGAAP